VHIIVPNPPGGSADSLPRILAAELGAVWKQPIIVENRAGAAGNVGAAYVSRAPADGLTLLASPATTLAINQSLYKTLDYDPTKLELITIIGSAPNVLIEDTRTEVDTITKNKNQTTGCHGEVVLYGFDSLSSNSMKSSNPHSGVHVDEVTKTLDTFHNCPSKNQGGNCVVHVTTKRVRRLTPVEFARLQGFPDDWAAIEGATDAQQYAAYGNSMTTNVMRWLGKRIKAVHDIMEEIALEALES
jgi:hypothetical protein